MRCFDVTKGMSKGEITPLEGKAFQEANTLLGVILWVFLVRISFTHIYPSL
jgi:hypothetical protein